MAPDSGRSILEIEWLVHRQAKLRKRSSLKAWWCLGAPTATPLVPVVKCLGSPEEPDGHPDEPSPQETAFSTNMIAPRASIHPRWIPPTPSIRSINAQQHPTQKTP